LHKHVVVQEVFLEYRCGFWKVQRMDKGGDFLEEKEKLMHEILQQEAVIKELKQQIQNLKVKMKERRKQLPKGYFPSYEENGSPAYTHRNSFDLGANSIDEDHQGHKSNENDVQLKESNMYAQMKHQPHKLYKSRSIRT